MKLVNRVKSLLKGSSGGMPRDDAWTNQQSFDTPVIYVRDEVARIYQHSSRGETEFPSMPPIANYCVGLAWYLQSPLNEYAALASDITAITFSEEYQQLIPREKLLSAFEKGLVDITNKVGVNINRAVAGEFYQHVLPFVCGLGPRKAQAMIKKIMGAGGNREQVIKSNILTTKIFFNASAFLRIPYREDPGQSHLPDDDDAPDPLDDNRIHLEDYELARKMAIDSLDADEEDYHHFHPSHVVGELMKDSEKERKLQELNLDDLAIGLYEDNQEHKRYTLGMIGDELLNPFGEQRRLYRAMDGWEVVTMLSGETEKSFSMGVILSVSVVRISKAAVNVKLDSGLEDIISAVYVADTPGNPDKLVKKGQTIVGVVIEQRFDWENDTFHVELSSRAQELKDGDSEFRQIGKDDNWNYTLAEWDQELMERKSGARAQRGDVVIRPPSKGADHLAVTWKVDDGLYQHIDITNVNGDPNDQPINEEWWLFVKPRPRQADEFKLKPEDDLHLSIFEELRSHEPSNEYDGYILNRKRPGHSDLCFLKQNAMVQTWPARGVHGPGEAYHLFDAAAAEILELATLSGFDVDIQHQQRKSKRMGQRRPCDASHRPPYHRRMTVDAPSKGPSGMPRIATKALSNQEYCTIRLPRPPKALFRVLTVSSLCSVTHKLELTTHLLEAAKSTACRNRSFALAQLRRYFNFSLRHRTFVALRTRPTQSYTLPECASAWRIALFPAEAQGCGSEPEGLQSHLSHHWQLAHAGSPSSQGGRMGETDNRGAEERHENTRRTRKIKEEEITDEEEGYISFYKWIHASPLKVSLESVFMLIFRVEFIPYHLSVVLYVFESEKGLRNIKLYVRCIVVMDDCQDSIPEYLNSVQRIVDFKGLQQNKIFKVISENFINNAGHFITEIFEDKDKFPKFYDALLARTILPSRPCKEVGSGALLVNPTDKCAITHLKDHKLEEAEGKRQCETEIVEFREICVILLVWRSDRKGIVKVGLSAHGLRMGAWTRPPTKKTVISPLTFAFTQRSYFLRVLPLQAAR
ncbi:hypothetical protein NMY22_g91 [Coprinellus aureogranulatus]|nr:hypothetical protein NMY22_g91 [Coprinellus aureogranulatus]